MRTAYFLDVENLVGHGLPSSGQVMEVLETFETLYEPGPSDLVYCAATSMAAFHLKLARPGYRVLVGRGKDGSDLQLLSMADIHFLSRSVHRVVLGSGDAIFEGLLLELQSRGLHVELLTGKGRLSHVLYRALSPSLESPSSPITQLKLAA